MSQKCSLQSVKIITCKVSPSTDKKLLMCCITKATWTEGARCTKTRKYYSSSCIHSASPKCQELLGNRHRGEALKWWHLRSRRSRTSASTTVKTPLWQKKKKENTKYLLGGEEVSLDVFMRRAQKIWICYPEQSLRNMKRLYCCVCKFFTWVKNLFSSVSDSGNHSNGRSTCGWAERHEIMSWSVDGVTRQAEQEPFTLCSTKINSTGAGERLVSEHKLYLLLRLLPTGP